MVIEGLEDKRRLSQSWEPCLRVEERCVYKSTIMIMSMSNILCRYKSRESRCSCGGKVKGKLEESIDFISLAANVADSGKSCPGVLISNDE